MFVAVLVGTNLAVPGTIFQAITRNEPASPFALGVSSGAGLTILLTLVAFSGLSAVLPLVASVGGAVAFLLVYAIAWTTGSLTGTDWEQIRMAAPWTVVAMLLALLSSRQLNALPFDGPTTPLDSHRGR